MDIVNTVAISIVCITFSTSLDFFFISPYPLNTGIAVPSIKERRISMSESNITHELAMLYLQKKDTSNLSPAELLDEHYKAYEEIYKHKTENHSGNWKF